MAIFGPFPCVQVDTPRTLTSIAINPSSTVMMTGDVDGKVRIFTWQVPVSPIPPPVAL